MKYKVGMKKNRRRLFRLGTRSSWLLVAGKNRERGPGKHQRCNLWIFGGSGFITAGIIKNAGLNIEKFKRFLREIVSRRVYKIT